MALFRDSLIALLAAMGLITVFFLAVKALFGREKDLASAVYLVLPVSEKTKDMERAVSVLQRFRREYGGAAKAVVLDCGMEEQQRRMAQILQREDPLLLIWQEEELLVEMKE